MELWQENGCHSHTGDGVCTVMRCSFDSAMAPESTVRWPVFLPLVLFFGGIGAAAAMTQLLGSF